MLVAVGVRDGVTEGVKVKVEVALGLMDDVAVGVAVLLGVTVAVGVPAVVANSGFGTINVSQILFVSPATRSEAEETNEI